jgi:hypothetical protein
MCSNCKIKIPAISATKSILLRKDAQNAPGDPLLCYLLRGRPLPGLLDADPMARRRRDAVLMQGQVGFSSGRSSAAPRPHGARLGLTVGLSSPSSESAC